MSARSHRLPPAQQAAIRRACWLQGVWIFFLTTIVLAMYFTLGSSQAMKTAWMEDLLSFVPPVAFLAAVWIERWKANARYPLGFVRIASISYLVAAVSLAGVALFMIYDSASALIAAEHPTIGSVEFFGWTFWFGWLMIAALVYSVIPPVIFGRLKMKPAQQLHDKVLYADALMNKADWMTGAAAVVGVLGIGLGWWWADAVAAMVIALDVLHDGYRHTMAAVRDLMDKTPRTVDDKNIDPLPKRAKETIDALPWVRSTKVQFREEGRYLSGSIFVVPAESSVSAEAIADGERRLKQIDWRMRMISLVVIPHIGQVEEQEL
ncbi:cation diffusion facilitator family transporter [Aurantimonas sp. HBX-1]|uniref:cation diffusion facilitator family transporter n=1 Tax=Aurantimonas sp. HBX-1 TaxID=2906072 RepID=UPI001F19C6E2|nr:cation diffusion facilitator family transporter [Aurantimonas sp. HBX-1]UIJ73329.1 cation diffusion facilitator family transporter [Aurantimonas sp. HBX-1]